MLRSSSWAVRLLVVSALVGVASQASATPINLATPAGLNPGDPFRFLFVTAATIAGTSSDIATYNSFVQSQGSGARYNGVTVNWKAIGTTATVNARDNVGGYGSLVPVYLPSGVRIADDMGITGKGLWSGFLYSAPDELLDGTAANATPWTGTRNWGGVADSLGTLGQSSAAIGQSSQSFFWSARFGNYTTSSYAMFGVSEQLTATAAVPEIDPAGIGSMLALIGGGLGLLERRRKRS